MLKAMQASGFGGENGEGSEEDFSKMLLGMMEQLTNKEILYEPMKELHDKFPEWMVKNEGTVKEEDMKRYKEQQVYVKEIVERFERVGYSDENVGDREYIVERMQKVCSSHLNGERQREGNCANDVCRCKRRAHLLLILWVIWLLLKKLLVRQKKDVRNNNMNGHIIEYHTNSMFDSDI